MSNPTLNAYLPSQSKQASWADAAEEADEFEQPAQTLQTREPRVSQPRSDARPQYSERSYDNDRGGRQQYDDNRGERRQQYGDRGDSRRDYNDRPQRSYNDRGDRQQYGSRDSRPYNEPRRNDRQYDREPRDSREPQREYQPVPLPTQAPWKAYFSNLAYDVTEEEVIEFCKPGVVLQVQFVRDREGNNKGTAFVEFETLEDLREVIAQYNGHNLAGRAVRIDAARSKDAAQRPQYDRPERTERRVRHDSTGSNTERRSRRTSTNDATIPERDLTEEERAARPKLALKPRTTTEQPAAPAQLTKSDIFGGARPREAVLAERPAAAEQKPAAEPAATGNTVKILTQPGLAPQSSVGKYQAKQPTSQSIIRDRQLQQQKRDVAPKPNGNKREFKPAAPREQKEEGVLKAQNAFDALGLEDED